MREIDLDRDTIERMNASAGPVLVALSGGGDSTALLHLLTERLGRSRVIAAVVDHALRPGSGEDAARAQSFAQALGVAAQVLPVTWPDGRRRAQAEARAARYEALCDAARGAGAHVIALGHTRDDQAETVLMRAARGSSWRGLAGMRAWARAPLWPAGRGVQVARPLLGASRGNLRMWLRARGAAWVEDPANANLAFARVRARTRLAALAKAGFEPARLADLAATLAAYAAALDRAAADLIGAAVRFEADRARITPSAWSGPASVRARALSALIAAAAGAQNEPRANSVRVLEAKLAAPCFKAATLGGAVVTRKGEAIWLKRDLGALTGRADGARAAAAAALPAGRELVWDGRVALRMSEPGWSVRVEAGAPVLALGEIRAPLTLAQPRWLLREHAAHLTSHD